MNLKFSHTLIALSLIGSSLCIVPSVQADTFLLTESINGNAISATFDGTFVTGSFNNLIGNISNFSLSINGGSTLNNNLQPYPYPTTPPLTNYISVDGLHNDFYFYKSGYHSVVAVLDGYSNQPGVYNSGIHNDVMGFGVTGPANNGLNGASNSVLDSWHVTDTTISAVPESEEWALMLLGLPLLGWAMRCKLA